MTEQAKVPAIRFAGFTDPWEQRKLGRSSMFAAVEITSIFLKDRFRFMELVVI